MYGEPSPDSGPSPKQESTKISDHGKPMMSNLPHTSDPLAFWRAELHDTAAQYLAAAIWTTELLQSYRNQWPTKARDLFDQLTTQLQTAHREVRRLLTDASPSLFQRGCQHAFELLIENLQTAHGPDVTYTLTPEAIQCCDHASETLRWTLYRVIQEAVTNANRHSGASQVQIFLSVCHMKNSSQISDHNRDKVDEMDGVESVVLEIKDNGKGFTIVESMKYERSAKRENGSGTICVNGYGLIGMRTRIAGLHGRCEIDSRPGLGTRIRVELPVIGMRMDSEPI